MLDNVLVGFQPHARTNIWQASFRSKYYRNEESRFKGEATALLEVMGLARDADTLAFNLPYGHQRRLEMARALATKPKLLLLDEPAAGLNVSEIQDLDRLIKKIQGHGITVILVEHHVDLVMGISDVVTVLDYGMKIAEGPPKRIQNDPKVIEAYLGEMDDAA